MFCSTDSIACICGFWCWYCRNLTGDPLLSDRLGTWYEMSKYYFTLSAVTSFTIHRHLYVTFWNKKKLKIHRSSLKVDLCLVFFSELHRFTMVHEVDIYNLKKIFNVIYYMTHWANQWHVINISLWVKDLYILNGMESFFCLSMV